MSGEQNVCPDFLVGWQCRCDQGGRTYDEYNAMIQDVNFSHPNRKTVFQVHSYSMVAVTPCG